jgi:hypothetical protein
MAVTGDGVGAVVASGEQAQKNGEWGEPSGVIALSWNKGSLPSTGTIWRAGRPLNRPKTST